MVLIYSKEIKALHRLSEPGKIHVLIWTQDFFLSFLKINLFIYLWLRWVFIAARRLSLVVASGGDSLLQCVGFSL